MSNDRLTYFEERLTNELKNIEDRIKELEAEKRALQRQLAKAKTERTGLQTATRKNSLNRVVAENSVIEMLKRERNPVTTKKLYKNAQLTNYDLKENTFRTYLHRMKKRGIIKTGHFSGSWVLTN